MKRKEKSAKERVICITAKMIILLTASSFSINSISALASEEESRVYPFSIYYADGSGSVEHERTEFEPWETLLIGALAETKGEPECIVYKKYENQPILTAKQAKEKTLVTLQGFAPNLRRDQWEEVDKLSRQAGLPGFDAKNAKALNVAVGSFEMEAESRDDIPYLDYPAVNYVGVFDEDYKTLLGACVQLVSCPLLDDKGKRFTETELYSIRESLQKNCDDFVSAYYGKVVPRLEYGEDLERTFRYHAEHYSPGGCYATAKQKKTFTDYFARQGWKGLDKEVVALRRTSSVYTQEPFFNVPYTEEILLAAANGANIRKGYQIPKSYSRYGLYEFYYASKIFVPDEGRPYIVDYCAVLSGDEKKGYRVDIAWLWVTPGNLNDEDIPPYGEALPASATQKDIDGVVSFWDGLPQSW